MESVIIKRMEKRRPHYDLSELQAYVHKFGMDLFSFTAKTGALDMGLTQSQAIEMVMDLSISGFYKSITTHADSSVWQDIYHAMTPVNRIAYIKLTMRLEGIVVIQFKEK